MSAIQSNFLNLTLNPKFKINNKDITTLKKMFNTSSNDIDFLKTLLTTKKGSYGRLYAVLNNYCNFDFSLENKQKEIYFIDRSGEDLAIKDQDKIQELILNNLVLGQSFGGFVVRIPIQHIKIKLNNSFFIRSIKNE